MALRSGLKDHAKKRDIGDTYGGNVDTDNFETHGLLDEHDAKQAGEELNKKVSAMNYYSYRLMVRENEENHILKYRQLFHQYIVDMYAKIETGRLLYIRLNQKKLRSEEYIHLRDAINNDGNVNNIGRMTILPATFTGSPRHMHEYAHKMQCHMLEIIMLNSKSDQLSNISPSSTMLTSPTTGGLGTLSEMAVTDKKSHKNHQNHNHAQHHHHPHLKGEDDETDVIGDLMGKYGKWQFYMTILLSLFQIPNTFHIASPLYQAANKDFWCRRPPNLNSTPVELWRNVSHSQDNCHILNIDWLQVTPGEMNNPNFQNLHSNPNISGLIPCKSWEFDPNDNIGETWNSEWDLVCDKEHLKNVAEMCFLLGVATGGIVSGYLSDKFGRKRMLFISVVLQTIFGIALYFPRSFVVYHVLRVLLGLVSVSVTYAGLILAIEYVDGKWQTIAGMYNLFPLPLSYMMVSGIAYLTQDFRYLQVIIGIPGFFLCFLWFVVPESPRWLLVKGRVAEVKTIIRAAAEMNKLELPDNMDKILIPPAVDSDESKAGICQLFKSKYLRLITFCFLCIWFSINIVYYGIILNMNTFGGNIYVTTALAGLVEIPAIAIAMYIILKVGKKWLFCATLFATGIACMCAAFAEGKPDILWLKITFVMIGKFTISASNIIMPVYTAELYPTAIRNVGVGAGNMAAGVALIATPYLSLLTKIEDYLLMLVFTAVAVFGGIVVIFLPEKSQHKEKHSEVVDEERST